MPRQSADAHRSGETSLAVSPHNEQVGPGALVAECGVGVVFDQVDVHAGALGSGAMNRFFDGILDEELELLVFVGNGLFCGVDLAECAARRPPSVDYPELTTGAMVRAVRKARTAPSEPSKAASTRR